MTFFGHFMFILNSPVLGTSGKKLKPPQRGFAEKKLQRVFDWDPVSCHLEKNLYYRHSVPEI